MRSKEQYIADFFPEIEPGIHPFGSDVLIQLRTTKTKTASGIVLVDDTREFNDENTMIGRIIRLGQLAFRNRETGQLWPEGVWGKPGDLVLVPNFGGFRFNRQLPDSEDRAKFVILKDYELRGGIVEGFEDLDKIV